MRPARKKQNLESNHPEEIAALALLCTDTDAGIKQKANTYKPRGPVDKGAVPREIYRTTWRNNK
jgi:hypothetical protein